MRIVTGIQPTGSLHLGNYLGAIRPLVDLQNSMSDDTQIYAFIADLHTLSAPLKPEERRRGVHEMTAGLLACGVSPDRTVLFRQSAVPHHAELHFLLNGIARMGPLERMTQYKDKAAALGDDAEGVRLALFTYPVLQAADILLYGATHVPVGDDQKQHIELARQIAAKFNREYGNKEPIFTIPQALSPPQGARVMSLQDGTRKMSKSDPSDLSRITLLDDKDAIARKIRKAKSDAEMLPEDAQNLAERPEARNLLTIHAALMRQTLEQSLMAFTGQGFGALKNSLIEVLIEQFLPAGERYRDIVSTKGRTDIVLAMGRQRAREAAAPMMRQAYQAMGFEGQDEPFV